MSRIYATRNYIEGESIQTLTPPEIYHKIFSGWHLADSSVMPTVMPAYDISVYGRYDENVSVITWLNKDGTVFASDTLYVGDDIVVRGAPNMDGWKFLGWSGLPQDGKVPSSDITVTPLFGKFSMILYYDNEIWYQCEFLAGDSWPEVQNPPRRLGEKFSGWSVSYETMPNSDVIGYAVVEECNVYTVKIICASNNDPGNNVSTLQFNDGEPFSVNWNELEYTRTTHKNYVIADDYGSKYIYGRPLQNHYPPVPETVTQDASIYVYMTREDNKDLFEYTSSTEFISRNYITGLKEGWSEKITSNNSSVFTLSEYIGENVYETYTNVSPSLAQLTEHPSIYTLDLSEAHANHITQYIFASNNGHIKNVIMPDNTYGQTFSETAFYGQEQLEKVYKNPENGRCRSGYTAKDTGDKMYFYIMDPRTGEEYRADKVKQVKKPFASNPLYYAHHLYDIHTGNEISTLNTSTYPALINDAYPYTEYIYGLEFTGWYGNNITLDASDPSITEMVIFRYAFADSSVNTVNISNNGICIQDYAFVDASIGTLNVEDVSYIGGFKYSKIKNLNLENVYAIAYNAFDSVTFQGNQSNINLGMVREFSQNSFRNCRNLTDFTLDSSWPPSLHGQAFYGVETQNINVHIPSGSLSRYQDSLWRNFNLVES